MSLQERQALYKRIKEFSKTTRSCSAGSLSRHFNIRYTEAMGFIKILINERKIAPFKEKVGHISIAHKAILMGKEDVKVEKKKSKVFKKTYKYYNLVKKNDLEFNEKEIPREVMELAEAAYLELMRTNNFGSGTFLQGLIGNQFHKYAWQGLDRSFYNDLLADSYMDIIQVILSKLEIEPLFLSQEKNTHYVTHVLKYKVLQRVLAKLQEKGAVARMDTMVSEEGDYNYVLNNKEHADYQWEHEMYQESPY